MANNFDEVMPKILAYGLKALRSECIMPRLVNTDYDRKAAEKGETITVTLPSSSTVRDVAPSHTPPAPTDSTPTSVPIVLNKWKESVFYLTDKDMRNIDDDIVPQSVSSAVKNIAEQVNLDIINVYKGVYGWHGTPGTTPFASDWKDAAKVRAVLNRQLAPKTDRRIVLDPDAEAAALSLRGFVDASFTGTTAGIMEGQINRKLGFDWFMDQQMPTHTKVAAGSWLVNDSSKVSVGSTSVTVDGGSTAPAVGDVFTVAGDTQTYVVKKATATSWDFAPKSVKEWVDNAAITFKDTHAVNLAFQRDAIAFATRPLADDKVADLGTKVMSHSDAKSGLALRLEISRQHKQIQWAFDILYGVELVRPECAARLVG